MNTQAPTELHLHHTAGCPDADPQAPFKAWAIGGGQAPLEEITHFAQRTVSLRSCGRGRLETLPADDDSGLVGHIVHRDRRSIPEIGASPSPPSLPAFGLDAGGESGHLIVAEASVEALRKSDGWLGKRLPALAGVLCLPLALAPTPALASASVSRRGRQTAVDEINDQADDEAATRVEPAASEPDTGLALPDSTWNAMMGNKVAITRTDGSAAAGELAAIDAEAATVILSDGSVVVVRRDSVAALRLLDEPAAPPPTTSVAPVVAASAEGAPADLPPSTDPTPVDTPRYHGLLAGGSVMVSIGGVLAISGMALGGYWSGSSAGIWAGGMLVPGLLLVSGGATMLGIGVSRKRQSRRAQITFAPNLDRTAWGGTLRVSF